MKDWHVGMEVVCINAQTFSGAPMPIKEGQVYKIRGFDAHPPYVLADYILGMGIYLEGISQDISPRTGKEYSFYARRFRPVVKPKKEVSIEIFNKILDGVNKGINVKIEERENEKV